jgi:hypothetical protein
MSKELKKAMTAGYEDATPPSPGDEVKQVETSVIPGSTPAPAEVKAEGVTGETEENKTQESEPAPKKVKFAPGLFSGFTLGSSVAQTPRGTVLSNFKESPQDYVANARNKGNTVMSAEDIQKLSQKK